MRQLPLWAAKRIKPTSAKMGQRSFTIQRWTRFSCKSAMTGWGVDSAITDACNVLCLSRASDEMYHEGRSK
jgi:hypothetical protein